MNEIKLFWKQDCPKCPDAKHISNGLKGEGFDVVEYDLETAEGLAEGVYYSVLSTPTLLVIDENDKEVLQWRGDVPTLDEIISVFSNNNVLPQRSC